MSHENKKLSFSYDFPAVSTKEWKNKIIEDLKGADYQKKLVWKTIEGFNLQPFYRKEDLEGLEYLNVNPNEFPYLRGSKIKSNDWKIKQDIDVENIKTANKKAVQAISKGATSIGFNLYNEIVNCKKEFAQLLKDILLDEISIHFISGNNTSNLINCFLDYLNQHQIDGTKIKGSFAYDPLGFLTTKGRFYKTEDEDFKILSELLKSVAQQLPRFKFIQINGVHFSNAGSSIVQELAFSLAIANEYIIKMLEVGLNINEIAFRIEFNLGIGSNYFMEIAKLRAARLLWANIVDAYNPKNEECLNMTINSITSNWNKTIYDSHVNILRATTESMSAALGGTDSINIKPFDSIFKKESEFSSHIARNTQIILKEEAYFNKIVDPAAGSYYIENITNSIIHETWKLFLEIEDKGGYIKAFKEGFVQSKTIAIAEQRKQLVSKRREIILGTNQYPNIDETMHAQIHYEKIFSRNINGSDKIAEPVIQYRAAEEFEKLRLQTEQSKIHPKVFLFTIGNSVIRKVRANFSSNFFASAGYEIIDNPGFNSIEEGIKAFEKTKAQIVAICSSDDEYSIIAPKIYEKIKHKTIVIVAGAPTCMKELENIGIEYFIHIKSNVLYELRTFNKLLGIK